MRLRNILIRLFMLFASGGLCYYVDFCDRFLDVVLEVVHDPNDDAFILLVSSLVLFLMGCFYVFFIVLVIRWITSSNNQVFLFFFISLLLVSIVISFKLTLLLFDVFDAAYTVYNNVGGEGLFVFLVYVFFLSALLLGAGALISAIIAEIKEDEYWW